MADISYYRQWLTEGKREIEESVYLDESNVGASIAEFAAWVKSAVPAEFAASARLDWTCDDYGQDAIRGVTYTRPETDAEYEKRVAGYRDEIAKIERAEHKELARLQAQYGDGRRG